MAKSKRTKESKERLNKFKTKQKSMSKENVQISAEMPQNQLPAVREIPVWRSNDLIEMKGAEFEALYNSINEMIQVMNGVAQGMFAAAQSVMQRNLLNGTIKVNYEKLVDKKAEDGSTYQEYEPMSEEEAAPHIENFNKMVEELKAKRDAVLNAAAEEKPTILSESGMPIGETPEIVDPIGKPISSN